MPSPKSLAFVVALTGFSTLLLAQETPVTAAAAAAPTATSTDKTPRPAAPAAEKPAAPMRLLDPAYAAALCKAWNTSLLPAALGRAGSEWIDSNDSKGRQVMVINRRDCEGWKKVRLVVEADAKGEARCTSGGANDGKSAFQWKFEPRTDQWADFTDGFGVGKMPGIMKGFEGSYGTAMNNISNFEVFFAIAGDLALKNKVDWACAGADMEDVRDEVGDIDRADMREIIAGD